jgi:O-antigen ligase
MAIIVISAFILVIISLFSITHAIGLWVLLLIIHGILSTVFGGAASHLPLFAGIVLVIAVLLRRGWRGVSIKVFFAFIGLLVVMSLAGFQGLDQGYSLLTTVNYAKGFLLALLIAGSLKNEKDIKVLTFYCLIGLVVGALVAVYQYKTGTYAINSIYVQRTASLRGDPNDTAMLLVMGIPLSVFWLSHAKKLPYKVLCFGIIILLLIGLILTSSRGGFVTLLAISTILFFKRPTLKMAVIGIVLCAVFLALAPQRYWDRMQGVVTGKEEHGARSIMSRKQLQIRGISMFFDHPILGVGPGNFGLAYIRKYEKKGIIGSTGNIERETYATSLGVAHNMHLEFFVENGFIGGTLMLFVFFLALQGSIKYDHRSRSEKKSFGIGFTVALTLSALLFAGLFLSQGKNSVLWFMIGLGLAMPRLSKVAPEPTPAAGICPKATDDTANTDRSVVSANVEQ